MRARGRSSTSRFRRTTAWRPLTQRIFYYHVPAAWAAYLAFAVILGFPLTAALVDAQHAQPFAAIWGDGRASSSDNGRLG